MENGAVYNATTEPQAKPVRRPFGCTLRHLWGWRLPAKALQAVSPLPYPALTPSSTRRGAGPRRAVAD
ncbi:cklf-like marvel transmembrane domain-containing protein 6 [Limosa lapponica baueri]|uniref:Cklf-like marvel transmembrane domain-containing protein 6 n=1 Tax=Limosa lapponica baueri TaxID=1758121 RepID=A0A2I0TIX6_LIMLA|nr:cklf-like marvel transmembrane domain-containing protein 6 [Limosa lapponica baueri]